MKAQSYLFHKIVSTVQGLPVLSQQGHQSIIIVNIDVP